MTKKDPDKLDRTLTPPASPEAEQSVLGAILVRPEVMDEVCDKLEPEDFYREAHARIYRVMLGLYNQEAPIDLVTVTQRLDDVGWLEGVGGPVFLAGLSEQVGFATNALYYAGVVKDKALLRRLLDTTQEIAGACLAPVDDVRIFLNEAEEKIYQLGSGQEVQTVYPESEVVGPEVQRLEMIFERKTEVLGVPSGLIDLDAITGGWQNGDLILVGGRPSSGKTAMAMNNLAYYPAKEAGTPVAVFSMEQPKEQLVQRQLASVGSINSYRMRSNKMDGEDWARLEAASTELMDLPIFFIDKPAMTTTEIRAISRRLKSKQNIGLIIIDYLQLARAKGAQSREQEVAKVSAAFKALAKELALPVIALAQLNRKVEDRPNKKPMLSDLRESGAMEADADVVLLLYRDEVYFPDSKDKGTAECSIAKHRNGPIGRVKLTYLKEFMRFGNFSREVYK